MIVDETGLFPLRARDLLAGLRSSVLREKRQDSPYLDSWRLRIVPGDSGESCGPGARLIISAGDCLRELQKIKRAWPDLLLLSPSPPVIAPSQLRLVE